MIRYFDNFDLKPYNTFAINAKASSFFEFTEIEDLLDFIGNKQMPSDFLVIGGGSNLLFINDFNGLIIYPNIPGISVQREDRNHVYVEAGAGVKWDDLVDYAVKYNFGGVENLSDIPGKVGASPVQNIGAYGVEVKDCICSVKGVFVETGQQFEFLNKDCKFGYRDSIFKNELKNKIVVTSVTYKLDKFPEFNLEYGALKKEVESKGEVNLQNVRQAVIQIRGSKLPDPAVLGNAGSFFKNPVVEQETVDRLKSEFSNLPVYESQEAGKLKVAAGWLIDQCGWKGYREGNVGVHQDQALVLVNYGNAAGREIIDLANKIQNSVFDKFGISISPEVNVIH
jgi:UDP-N-acetylmuramate dehydrogenase